MKSIGLAFTLTIFANAAWAETCSTPAVKDGRPLTGFRKRVFIKDCCERLAETRGVAFEKKRTFIVVCQGRGIKH